MKAHRHLRKLMQGALGCALLLVLWELAGRSGALGKTLPALTQVLAVYAQPIRRALLLRSAAATLSAAAFGFGLGAIAGLSVAGVAHLLPPLRDGLDRLAVLVNALPVIALGPVLIITVGREGTPAALASVPVFFLLYTSSSAGLRIASGRLQLVLTTLGASPWQRLRRLEAIGALPSVLNGMKVAAGSAMIGAIVRRVVWGAHGPRHRGAQQHAELSDPAHVGNCAGHCDNYAGELRNTYPVGAISTAADGLMRHFIQHFTRRLVRELWAALLLLGAWQLWVDTGGYSSVVLVSPVAVLSDLIHAPGAYLLPTLRTLAFALTGLALGMLAGVALAAGAWFSELIGGMTTPVALLVSSTPVVCLIPILARFFGYEGRTELATVAVMTFFPSFIFSASGLRDLPPTSPQVFAVLHSSRWQRLRLLALPAAAPSIAVALRVGTTYSILVALLPNTSCRPEAWVRYSPSPCSSSTWRAHSAQAC